MTVTDENDICSRLETIAGVRVSQDWLTACRAHLRETRLAETADSILHQVLHSDLRDVVSRQDDDGMLRRALQEEFAELPESFRLMVQVEELLDVSLNAEARLSVGPASPTSPTPVGNQHMRCLKLYFSDGYLLLGGIHLVGMEMAPIPDLSVHSKAGLKLILKGPLTCRFGIIMCSPSNTNVLGGSVVSLMEMQQKTLEQAQRLAGVGVDPTVKALIWNPIGAEEEGEGTNTHGAIIFLCLYKLTQLICMLCFHFWYSTGRGRT
jgi:RecQ-mediated genome instability protein 1